MNLPPFLALGGHRGSGCTDSLYARQYSGPKPSENTLPSFQQAFAKGAEFVEIDVVRTADNGVVVIHSNLLADHIFPGPRPSTFVGDMTTEALAALRVGPDQRGRIPTLKEVLDYIATLSKPERPGGFRLNIELKDVKGTRAPKNIPGRPSLVELVVRELESHTVPLDWIVLSSFATEDLIEAARLLPKARLAHLFERDRKFESPIYPQNSSLQTRYIHFVEKNLVAVRNLIPTLEFAHPEIQSIHPAIVKTSFDMGLGLTAWVWLESPPAEDCRFLDRFLALSLEDYPRLGLITDFLPEVIEHTKRKIFTKQKSFLL